MKSFPCVSEAVLTADVGLRLLVYESRKEFYGEVADCDLNDDCECEFVQMLER